MIEILDYKPVAKNKVIGYVTVRYSIGNIKMRINRISHMQSGPKRWFSFPIYSENTADGSIKYTRHWHYEDPAHNAQFLQALEKPVADFIEKHNLVPGVEEMPKQMDQALLKIASDEGLLPKYN